jgi:hypothetical protein
LILTLFLLAEYPYRVCDDLVENFLITSLFIPFTKFYDDFVPDLDQSDDDSSVSSETTVSEGEDDENDDFSIKVEETSISDEADYRE